jgi:CRISPR-associated protein Cmr1
MMLRKPPTTLDPKIALDSITQPIWTTLDCQLITPLYGGGVKAHTIDESMPIRVSSIRGQLRFWWRLLATHLWKLGDVNAIRQAETDLWGGIGDKTKASKVFLRVSSTDKVTPISFTDIAGARYVLFPAYNETNGAPHNLIHAGFKWKLDISFAKSFTPDPKTPDYYPNATNTQKEQVWEAIRWWASFGGIGARTRRGLGAFQIIGIKGDNLPSNIRTPVSVAEAENADCQLTLGYENNNALIAWQASVRKLQEFRQSPSVGRNEGEARNRPGRSRWPEPDAIRRIKRTHLIQGEKTHEPVHQAGNLFPRAAFGLPIIFKFKDDRVHGYGNQPDPEQTSLQPVVNGTLQNRMASPLILRPYFDGNRWRSAAFLLPCSHLNHLKLDLSGDQVTYWDHTQANSVTPISQNNGIDALTAFMSFFAN